MHRSTSWRSQEGQGRADRRTRHAAMLEALQRTHRASSKAANASMAAQELADPTRGVTGWRAVDNALNGGLLVRRPAVLPFRATRRCRVELSMLAPLPLAWARSEALSRAPSTRPSLACWAQSCCALASPAVAPALPEAKVIPAEAGHIVTERAPDGRAEGRVWAALTCGGDVAGESCSGRSSR